MTQTCSVAGFSWTIRSRSVTHKSYSDLIPFHPRYRCFSDCTSELSSSPLYVKYRDAAPLECASYGNAGFILCTVTDIIYIWDGCSCGRSKTLGMIISTISQTHTARLCVCVVSCDICIELSLLSAQWSCEFNLSGTINLSTAGCCPHVWSIIHTWSLTSIYGGDKRGVRVLQGKYGVASTPFCLLLSRSFQLGLKLSFIWPACRPAQL